MSNASSYTLGVIGLGSMGMGAALSALRQGVTTWGCDPRADARAAFEQAGGRATASVAELASHSDVVLVLVVNAAQTEDVLFGAQGVASTLKHGGVVVCSATVDPALPPVWEERLLATGHWLIDGPVSGGAKKAAAGQMTVMASGQPEAFAAAGSVLEAFAGKVYRLGDKAGIGSTVKMVNQHLAGVHIATACEAMALGMRAGAEPRQLYEVICNSAGMSWMFENRVPHILDGDYTPLSAVNIFIKDLGIVLDAARQLKFPLPLAAAAHQLYLATAAMGLGAEDDSAVVKYYAQLAGIELPAPAPAVQAEA
ncbi:NAD-binding of NADP-dependent 3-hydroxyisobutyrate dehydrogenase family protein [Hydrogenophaga sp. RAC07]|uniref:L-threonate dehydrogenase n=1 Tax=Hydrogenophaga sp. RAC07 TaxID=1842537 RepID=UPI00083D6233|nr:L-threonate dehydrogenase [Hydrogenophaga sp. RAC07]AOF83868.1 NAD-binding of NADP-dependent 3-hydroxyisobutyrate dehydrogenase family protein [Hydrogenophaga sp. RAC07]